MSKSLENSVLSMVTKAGALSAADVVIRLASHASFLFSALQSLRATRDIEVRGQEHDFEKLMAELEKIQESHKEPEKMKEDLLTYLRSHDDKLSDLELVPSASGYRKVS